MIGGRFEPLTLLDADVTEMDALINTFNQYSRVRNPCIKSVIRYGRQESGPYHGPSLLSLPFPRKVTFNS